LCLLSSLLEWIVALPVLESVAVVVVPIVFSVAVIVVVVIVFALRWMGVMLVRYCWSQGFEAR
jgi:hypothetical protein